MRDDTNVRNAIASDKEKEANSACCVLNDGSGCVQTVEEKCSVCAVTMDEYLLMSFIV